MNICFGHLMQVSTHDMKLVEELLLRTIVMDEGFIVADGMTKEILADEELLNEHRFREAMKESKWAKYRYASSMDGLLLFVKAGHCV